MRCSGHHELDYSFIRMLEKNFLIWMSLVKSKHVCSCDYMNQRIKLIRSMKNSRTHHNLGADRWDPQLCVYVSSLRKHNFLKPNIPWDPLT
jgi:hypothetical protein